MQLRGVRNDIRIYDDFAHHPTAIKTTLEGLRAKVGAGRILVAFEPRSNTMRMGIHKETLGAAFDAADEAFVLLSRDLDWGEEGLQMNVPSHIFTSVDALLEALTKQSRSGDSIIIMSNGGFENLPVRLLDAL
jgi:UDP-N-acetylmuramate: L-alanyl-gamma-D-glutamyl-meso-diaminopimelate ligase